MEFGDADGSFGMPEIHHNGVKLLIYEECKPAENKGC